MYVKECMGIDGKIDIKCMRKTTKINCFNLLEGKKCPLLENFDNIEKFGNSECGSLFAQIKSCLERNREFELELGHYQYLNRELAEFEKAMNECKNYGYIDIQAENIFILSGTNFRKNIQLQIRIADVIVKKLISIIFKQNPILIINIIKLT